MIDKAIEAARQLSALDSCTIWALLTYSSLGYIFWSKKKEMDSQKGWQEIRNKQIASEVAQTEVMRQLVSEISSMKMLLIKGKE